MKYPLSPGDRAGLENRHTYHAPGADQAARYESIRRWAREYSEALLQMCPPSRERSLALIKIEEAVFWANAAIARNERAEGAH